MITPIIRRLLLLMISALFVQVLSGQKNRQTDSLLLVFHTSHDNVIKSRLLLKISTNEELSDPLKALQYARQALQMAQLADFESAEVRAMILMGATLNRLNDLKEATEIGRQIIESA